MSNTSTIMHFYENPDMLKIMSTQYRDDFLFLPF